ncbi:MAG: tetratricopeptide repeat protein [Cyclobacteriaceae bacterium]
MRITLILLAISLRLTLNSQNLDSIISAHEGASASKLVKVLEDGAWDNINSDFHTAERYALLSKSISDTANYLNGIAMSTNTLGVIYRKQSRYQESMALYRQSLKAWNELNNQKQMASCYQNMANVTRAMGLTDSAFYFAEKALNIGQSLNDSMRISGVLTTLGNLSKDVGKHEQAIQYYLETAKIDEAFGDSFYLSIDYSNIADLLRMINQYDKALEYYLLSWKLVKNSKDKLNESIALGSIGVAYNDLELKDSAAFYYQKSLELAQDINDSIGISQILNYQGELAYDEKRYEQALNIYSNSQLIAASIGEVRIVGLSKYGMGQSLIGLNKTKSALKLLREALQIAIETDNSELELSCYTALSNGYKTVNEPVLALRYLEQYVAKNDSVNSAQLQTRVADLETKYETEKKEQQIILLDSQNQLQAAIIDRNNLWLTIGLISFISLTGIGFLFYKQRSLKISTQFEKEKSALKAEQIQAVISSQEQERKRFAMDLHDNFGQLISALRLLVGQSGELKDKSSEILDKMYHSLKSIAFDLMPHTLMEKGLDKALDELYTQLNGLGGIKFNYRSFAPDLTMAKDHEIATYRIIQELTSNMMKYASSTKAEISLTQLDDQISIMLEDNGLGFDPQAFYHSTGNGWKNIKSRLDLMSGEIEIDAAPNRPGTTISLSIPLTNLMNQAA